VLSKFLSRKFLVAVVSFVTVSIAPNLSSSTQAHLQALIAGVYLVAQGFADAFGGGKPSQGQTS
jgi:hypothetical protein